MLRTAGARYNSRMKKTSLDRVREIAAQPVATTDEARAIVATAKTLDDRALDSAVGGAGSTGTLRTGNTIAA